MFLSFIYIVITYIVVLQRVYREIVALRVQIVSMMIIEFYRSFATDTHPRWKRP